MGRRHGGQRYLANDLDALARAAAVVAERLETLREHEMHRLVSQAELRALQSQINPHFLFNALNTVYGTIPREGVAARRMVLNLAEMFRYFLQSNKTLVPLREELEIVRAYLAVEQVRLGDRLAVDIRVEEAAMEVVIPALSVQPLVENAIKHGVTPSSDPGYVRVRSEFRNRDLFIRVENSRSNDTRNSEGPGVGLQNVRRRLEICYGGGAELRLLAGHSQTIVELRIPAVDRATNSARN
jgi:LytS/YehU family sensor histidine kinase